MIHRLLCYFGVHSVLPVFTCSDCPSANLPALARLTPQNLTSVNLPFDKAKSVSLHLLCAFRSVFSCYGPLATAELLSPRLFFSSFSSGLSILHFQQLWNEILIDFFWRETLFHWCNRTPRTWNLKPKIHTRTQRTKKALKDFFAARRKSLEKLAATCECAPAYVRLIKLVHLSEKLWRERFSNKEREKSFDLTFIPNIRRSYNIHAVAENTGT